MDAVVHFADHHPSIATPKAAIRVLFCSAHGDMMGGDLLAHDDGFKAYVVAGAGAALTEDLLDVLDGRTPKKVCALCTTAQKEAAHA